MRRIDDNLDERGILSNYLPQGKTFSLQDGKSLVREGRDRQPGASLHLSFQWVAESGSAIPARGVSIRSTLGLNVQDFALAGSARVGESAQPLEKPIDERELDG